VGTLLLTRYLAPAEYGEVTAAAIAALTANGVTTFGVGTYLVAHGEIPRRDAFHVTSWFLATGLIAVVALLTLGGPLGTWSDARLERFVPWFAASVVLDRVAYVPERILVRRLRFRWLSLARSAAEVAYSGVSLAGAMLGAGAVAVAWGAVARSALRFAAIVPAVDWRDWLEPHRLRLTTMKGIVRYGADVSVAAVANVLLRRWDNMLVSRYFGPAAMGAYNYAYNLADTPATAVGEQMVDVVGASFPHVEPQGRADALLHAWTMTALVMLPLAFGLGSVAETVVQTFLDERWHDVGAMMALLAAVAATRPLAELLRSYLYACERPRVVAWLEWMGLGALVVALATVGRTGIGWACVSVSSAFALRLLASLGAVRRVDGIPLARFLRPLVGPLASCAAMAAAIALARPALRGATPVVRLTVEVILGAMVYVSGALLLFRASARDLLGLARSALGRR
jgi:PST family polysaccharide transporter